MWREREMDWNATKAPSRTWTRDLEVMVCALSPKAPEPENIWRWFYQRNYFNDSSNIKINCWLILFLVSSLSCLLFDLWPQHCQLWAPSHWLQQEGDSSVVGPSSFGPPRPVRALSSGPVQGGAAGLGVLGGVVERWRWHWRHLQQHLQRQRHGKLSARTQQAVLESGVFGGKLYTVPW